MTATRITFEGVDSLPPEVFREAKKSLDRLEQTKALLGLSDLNKSFLLQDDIQAYVVSNLFVSRIHLIIPSKSTEELFETTSSIDYGATAPVCDFVSGIVKNTTMQKVTVTRTKGTVFPSKSLDLAPAEYWGYDNIQQEHVEGIDTTRLGDEDEEVVDLDVYRLTSLTQTVKSLERFTDEEAKLKLAVRPGHTHSPLETPDPPKSQHTYVKPGDFSGYMRAVVQLLLGIGIVGPKTYEVKWIAEAGEGETRGYVDGLNPKQAASGNEVAVESGFGLPCDWDKEGFAVTLEYDYRFLTTHGLSWGAQTNDPDLPAGLICYLVEIGIKGVFAMPLPLDPVSLLPQGKARYLELFPELGERDLHNSSMFEMLGGFPTGVSFPKSSITLQSWVRAGEVVELVSAEEMQAFYEGTFTGSGMGWIFNKYGGRADNVCIKWEGNPGTKKGYHYTVLFTINPFNAALDAPNPGYAGWLNPEKTEAHLIKKAKRLNEGQFTQIMAITGTEDTTSEELYEERVAYLDELIVPSPYTGTGRLIEKRSGFLYHPGKAQPIDCASWSGQPQIKFYEPVLGHLVSFNFSCEAGGVTPTRCDAPIAIVQTGDGISVINYYYERQGNFERTSWDTRADCQFTGKWRQGFKDEATVCSGNFYTSDVDLRKKRDAFGFHNRTTEGTFAYYASSWNRCMPLAIHHTLDLGVYHSYTWEQESYGSKSFKSAIAFPGGDRNIYYAVTYEETDSLQRLNGFNPPSISGTGPIKRYGKIYHCLMHWIGRCIAPPPHRDVELTCRMVEYKAPTSVETCFTDAPAPTWIDFEVKPCRPSEGDCTGAQGGSGGLPSGGTAWIVVTQEGNEIEWSVRLYGDLPIKFLQTKKGKKAGFIEGTDNPLDFYASGLSNWWFWPSPDACNRVCHLYAMQSWWGNQICNVEDQVDAMETKHFGSPNTLTGSARATYVGYIR